MRPAGPTNGLPCRSSRSPGCSPTNIATELRRPAPNTVWVAFSQSGHARQSAAASRSFGRVGRAGTSSRAESGIFSAFPGLTRAKHGTCDHSYEGQAQRTLHRFLIGPLRNVLRRLKTVHFD